MVDLTNMSARFVTLVAVEVVLQCFVPLTSACPTDCTCKWKDGKLTIKCTDMNLTNFPVGIDLTTQVIDFAGNNLISLPREKFQKEGLTNLQRIYLSRCKIAAIDDRAFKGLTNLVDLDLSENALTSVPTETFSDYPLLMRLILSNNPLTVLHRAAFKHLSYLTTLELRFCDINQIEDETFVGLKKLEWLKLDGNQLTTIQGEHILPEALHGIELNNNNWDCDCHMLDLHAWLHNFKKIPHTIEPTCASPPRLSKKTIRSIEVADMACLPDVSPTTLYLEIGEGKNVSLLCKVTAVPEANVSWWFEGKVLQNGSMVAPGYHLYYYIEEGTEEKRSELFIYNTNTGDNGTFMCVAENAAGKILSNFTIRVVVKEEPEMEVESISYEYLIAVTAGVSVLIIVLIIIIIVSIVKCRRNQRRREIQRRTKEIALQNRNTGIEETPEPADGEVDGDSILTDREETIISAEVTVSEENIPSTSGSNQLRSPRSLRNYPTEQNPDLIIHSENIAKHNFQRGFEVGIADFGAVVHMPMSNQMQWQNMVIQVSDKIAADVHLSPGYLMNQDEYSINFLQDVSNKSQMPNDQLYRTLPHKRASKRLSAANPMGRHSREVEFLFHDNQQSASYEHYCPEVRNTADGYPRAHTSIINSFDPDEIAYPDDTYFPSPPEEYKTDITPLPLRCPSPPKIDQTKWPPCIAVGLNMPIHDVNKTKLALITQSNTGQVQQEIVTPAASGIANARVFSVKKSPDEGFAGEANARI